MHHSVDRMSIEKSIDGVIGIWTWGRRMVGVDETMDLWRQPFLYTPTLAFE